MREVMPRSVFEIPVPNQDISVRVCVFPYLYGLEVAHVPSAIRRRTPHQLGLCLRHRGFASHTCSTVI